MNMKFVKSSEKKRLLKVLNEQFGISKLGFLLVETGKNKVRGFSGTMTREEIKELCELARVEIVGGYLFKSEGKDINRLRLSLDGSMILKEQLSKNIVEIDESETDLWLRGKDVNMEIEKGIYVVKNGDDFMGCGISNWKKLINHVPKERRIRNS